MTTLGQADFAGSLTVQEALKEAAETGKTVKVPYELEVQPGGSYSLGPKQEGAPSGNILLVAGALVAGLFLGKLIKL